MKEGISESAKAGYKPKTISKHYFDHEIKGYWYESGRLVVYLHDDVRRLAYDPLEEWVIEENIGFKQTLHDLVAKRDALTSEEGFN